ncbi:NEDD8-activating enzyme E1 regulatory subunit isoform X2 [Cimex lectularius]|uniref:NEDD8-activating enzyme E1 regulatory subunit n=1 Tax=Cimex lectularius TaxID=79782 RepID=A0A8I6RFK4_CIMLE|nr:NEDD8-activating enzyme E1 regulatory subunit isoform X2 [Cimex lectularius]
MGTKWSTLTSDQNIDSVGKPRAQVCTEFLVELNPDVKGDYVDESVEELLENNPNFFSNFSVVIATAIPERSLVPLSELLWTLNIPLVIAKSFGFIGYTRLQVKEHTVVESHPDTQNPDLRLDRPFPALVQHLTSVNMHEMDLKDHAHVPYVVPLFLSLQEWKHSHNNELPKNYKEKEAFKQLIRNHLKKNEDGIPEAEENFEEAIRAVNFAIATTKIPSNVQNILNDDSCINLTSKSKPFWILAKALKDFIENEGNGCLPLRGSLPDMTAETKRYIALQQIYLQEANRCAELVHRRVQQLLHQVGQPIDLIKESETKQFCKYASDIAVIRGSKIADEYDSKLINTHLISQGVDDAESLIVYYVLIRGTDRFYGEYNHYPGEFKDEQDIVKLKACISKLLTEWGCGPLSKDDYVHEFCRYGGAELHSISAFLGGCVAQEVIKLVTRQYKILHNTFIYDAISSNTETFIF